MPQLTYSPDSSPTVGGSSQGSESNPSLLWFEGKGSEKKIEYLNKRAGELGHCYVRLLIFCSELARIPQIEFENAVEFFIEELGEYPLGHDVFTELPTMNHRELSDKVVKRMTPARIEEIFSELKQSKARVMVTRVEDSDLFHVASLPERPFCECQGPICQHGWEFRMCMVALGQHSRRIGASGFNMDEFLGKFEDESPESAFEEAFSQLAVPIEERAQKPSWKDTKARNREYMDGGKPKVKRITEEELINNIEEESGSEVDRGSAARNTLNHTKEKIKRIQRLMPEPLDLNVGVDDVEIDKLKKIENRLSTLTSLIELQADMAQKNFFSSPTPPASPPNPRYHLDELETVLPNDSSSVLGRYQKKFMDHGTVITMQPAGNESDRKASRTQMNIENHLVDGFQRTELIVEKETKAVSRLKTINGLPRPFTNMRLNFLCNMHTAMTLKLKKNSGSYLEAMYDAMRSKPVLPVESLLCNVLNATIDRREGTYVSNAFNLPYIEVGMLFTEESVVKMFDLLQLEYKKVWFQEMKSLIVPNFHGDYKGVSTGVLGSKLSKAIAEESDRERSSRSSRKGSRSRLGF